MSFSIPHNTLSPHKNFRNTWSLGITPIKENMKIQQLRNLPFRKWDEVKTYKSIVVIPSGKKHESGWALMYIIGLDSERKPIEIAAACDDICWIIPSKTDFNFRNDMFYPSGAIHFWGRWHSFKVGASLSSTTVSLVED